MKFIAYLKKHRSSFMLKCSISLVSLSVLTLIIMGSMTANPLLYAALAGFAIFIHPVGFSSLLLVALLLGGVLCSTTWLAVEYQMQQRRKRVALEIHPDEVSLPIQIPLDNETPLVLSMPTDEVIPLSSEEEEAWKDVKFELGVRYTVYTKEIKKYDGYYTPMLFKKIYQNHVSFFICGNIQGGKKYTQLAPIQALLALDFDTVEQLSISATQHREIYEEIRARRAHFPPPLIKSTIPVRKKGKRINLPEIKANSTDDPIENFRREGENAIKSVERAVLSNQKMIVITQLKQLRKTYYTLARQYHPDLEQDEGKKLIKQADFQRLNEIYQDTIKKLEALEKKLKRKPRRADDLSDAYIQALKERNRQQDEEIAMLKRAIQEMRDERERVLKEFEEYWNNEIHRSMTALKAEIIAELAAELAAEITSNNQENNNEAEIVNLTYLEEESEELQEESRYNRSKCIPF